MESPPLTSRRRISAERRDPAGARSRAAWSGTLGGHAAAPRARAAAGTLADVLELIEHVLQPRRPAVPAPASPDRPAGDPFAPIIDDLPENFDADARRLVIGVAGPNVYDMRRIACVHDLGGDDLDHIDAGGPFRQIVIDAAGNDLYRGNRYGQAFAAHQAVGVLLDRGGASRFSSSRTGSRRVLGTMHEADPARSRACGLFLRE